MRRRNISYQACSGAWKGQVCSGIVEHFRVVYYRITRVKVRVTDVR